MGGEHCHATSLLRLEDLHDGWCGRGLGAIRFPIPIIVMRTIIC